MAHDDRTPRDSRRTFARTYAAAEGAAIARLRAKVASVEVAIHSRDPWSDPTDRAIRARESALATSPRDGAPATARLDAKLRPIVATEFEGDPRVNGALVRLRARVRPDLGRAQAQTRGAIARADAAIATIARYDALRASMVPGGATWSRCSRDDRRRLRAVVHRADASRDAGDLASAIETLLHG